MRRRHPRGNSIVEFTLAGIPIIFGAISVVEIARGLWMYASLAHAVQAGTRYASVHGNNCQLAPNSCGVTIADVARRMTNAAVVSPAQIVNVVFVSNSSARPVVSCPTLKDCIDGEAGTTPWPVTGPSDPGGEAGQDVQITAECVFDSAIAMIFPGAASVKFGTITFSTAQKERIHF